MTTLFSTLFILCGLMLGYLYGGYGLTLRLWLAFKGPAAKNITGNATKEGTEKAEPPSVTILLCVHNEEHRITERLDNLMTLTYPPDKLEVLVVSDGSTDKTESLVETYQGAFPVRLLRTERAGKSGAQNYAVPEARGEIVVLTDAEAVFDPAFVQEIVAPFRDPAIGCATGNLGLMERSGAIAANQGLYWRYEQALRAMENDLGLLVVASGQSMAFRRALYQPIPTHVGDDCFIPLIAARQGYRTAYVETAKAFDVFEHEPEKEYATRVRMTLRNWVCTSLFPDLLNPARHAGLAFALWSHKMLRWMGGAFLGLLALSAPFALMSDCLLVQAAALGAIGFFGAGAYGAWLWRRGETPEGLLGAIFSFLLVNAAFTEGLYRALTGQKIVAYKAGTVKVEAKERP